MSDDVRHRHEIIADLVAERKRNYDLEQRIARLEAAFAQLVAECVDDGDDALLAKCRALLAEGGK